MELKHMHPGGADPVMLMTLGELRAQSYRQTEILLSTLQETRALRDQLHSIATRMPTQRNPKSGAQLFQYVKLAVAMIILALMVAGKLAWADGFPMLRTLIGLG